MTRPGSLPVTLSPYAELAAALPSQVARKLVSARLAQISFGQITIVEDGVSRIFGQSGGELQAAIRVHHPGAWTAVALGGSLGAGESCMGGLWSADDLVSAVRIMLRASTRISDLDGSGLPVLRSALEGIYRRMRRNTGGQLPSLDAMSTAWGKQTDLRSLHFEDFSADYAHTPRVVVAFSWAAIRGRRPRLPGAVPAHVGLLTRGLRRLVPRAPVRCRAATIGAPRSAACSAGAAPDNSMTLRCRQSGFGKHEHL